VSGGPLDGAARSAMGRGRAKAWRPATFSIGVIPRESNPHGFVDHMFKRHYELLEFKIGI
jgi:hypothetical protein